MPFIPKVPSIRETKHKFKIMYTVGYSECQMFQDMEIIGYDHIEYFRQNKYQVNIDNNGILRLVFIGTLESDPTEEMLQKMGRNAPNTTTTTNMIPCRFGLATISKSADDECTCRYSTCLLKYPKDGMTKLDATYEKLKMAILKELKRIRTEQSRLPKKYFDYSKYENLIFHLHQLDQCKTD